MQYQKNVEKIGKKREDIVQIVEINALLDYKRISARLVFLMSREAEGRNDSIDISTGVLVNTCRSIRHVFLIYGEQSIVLAVVNCEATKTDPKKSCCYLLVLLELCICTKTNLFMTALTLLLLLKKHRHFWRCWPTKNRYNLGNGFSFRPKISGLFFSLLQGGKFNVKISPPPSLKSL